jgi:hypothetical protein
MALADAEARKEVFDAHHNEKKKKPSRFQNVTRASYWLRVESLAMSFLTDDLDENIPYYPADVLVGMAITLCSQPPPRGYHSQVLKCLYAAAFSNDPPSNAAKAIVRNVLVANPEETPDELCLNTDQVLSLLFDATATGSFISSQDLKATDLERYWEARSIFQKHGGYNTPLQAQNLTGKWFESSPKALDEWLSEVDLHDMSNRIRKGYVHGATGGNTWLHVAATYGYTVIVHTIVSQHLIDVNAKNDAGETALYKACLAGHYNVVRVLVEHGADASLSVGQSQITCLHWLFGFEPNQMESVATLLISAKGEVSARVHSVYKIPTSEHFPFFWPVGTPFHWACYTNSIAAAAILLDKGSAIDELDETDQFNGRTGLVLAMLRGSPTMVRFLLSRGADPKRTNSHGASPLHSLITSQ